MRNAESLLICSGRTTILFVSPVVSGEKMHNKKTLEPPVMDRKAAARYLGYSPGTLAVWKSTKRYDLPTIKIGRAIRYRKVDLDKFLEERLTA